MSKRGQQGKRIPPGGRPAMMALEPRYMYDAAAVAVLDDFKNLVYENGLSKIEELQASAEGNAAARDPAGTFKSPDLEAFPVFKEPSGTGLRKEFEANAEAQTLKDIPFGPEGHSVYALSGAFSMPALQGDPIGYVWCAPAPGGGFSVYNTREYFKALRENLALGSVPQTESERVYEALSWQDDVMMERYDAEMEIEDERAAVNDEFNALSEVVPLALEQSDVMEKALENMDLDASRDLIEESPDMAAYERDLNRLEAEDRLMTAFVRQDKELELLDKELDAADKALENEFQTMDAQAAPAELDKSANVYEYDVDSYMLYSDFDDLLWDLWLNEMRDMSVNLDTDGDVLGEWMRENAELDASFAPLDNAGDFKQIQDKFSELGDDVADLLRKIEGKSNAKDRK